MEQLANVIYLTTPGRLSVIAIDQDEEDTIQVADYDGQLAVTWPLEGFAWPSGQIGELHTCHWVQEPITTCEEYCYEA